jgi:septum formation protein
VRSSTTSSPRLVLASASPRRSELLRAAGVPFDVVTADVDESLRPGEQPDAYVRRLAEDKARTVAAAMSDRYVLGADTVVVLGASILGKPRDAADARRMLALLSGHTHEVLTGVCLVGPAAASGAAAAVTRVAVTAVEMAVLSDAEIDWYVASGEPMDKAGAYAVQGLASRFVRRLEGSYSNVVGLPVALVYGMCRDAGLLLS